MWGIFPATLSIVILDLMPNNSDKSKIIKPSCDKSKIIKPRCH